MGFALRDRASFTLAISLAILYAAEHPIRDFIVGDVGRILDALQRVSSKQGKLPQPKVNLLAVVRKNW
jgi:hypothetical protein